MKDPQLWIYTSVQDCTTPRIFQLGDVDRAIVLSYADSPEKSILLSYVRKFGIPYVLFGSDYPVHTPKETRAALSEYGFTKDELAKILGSNTATLYKQ